VQLTGQVRDDRFAGPVFQKLRDAGHVDRLIVVMPNVAIVEQWKAALEGLRIHLDTEPGDGFLEPEDTASAVITYHRCGTMWPGGARRWRWSVTIWSGMGRVCRNRTCRAGTPRSTGTSARLPDLTTSRARDRSHSESLESRDQNSFAGCCS
jgi:hypothetical protein